MAGTEHETRHQQRRFVTRHDVEDASAAGQPVRLRGRDVITHEAAQRARDLGVAVEREPAAGASRAPAARPAGATPAAGGPAATATLDDLRRAVRAAVVAELGSEPPGLDAVIAGVLSRRER